MRLQFTQKIIELIPMYRIAYLFLTALCFGLSPIYAETVNHQTLIKSAKQSPQWLTHGRDYSETRFSPLAQINTSNVSTLGLDWSYEFDDNRALEATPLIADGVLYTSSSWSKVYAFNAKTGELLWKYDPEVKKAWLARACCGPINRGVALWEDKVFVGTLDGYLVAIDRTTGEEVWRTLTIDPTKDYTITGAPRVVKGKVIIGNGGAEYGVRGYVSAFDVNTGEQLWRFYTVPGNPATDNDATTQRAANTWTGEWWKLGGGGTVWDSMAFDPELNLLYIGVGNGSPWNQALRSPEGGDNLYLSSIVALNPDNGDYVWHYQTTPGESWDYTATQQMILSRIQWQGEGRDVIMQAPKNGFFFILDRKTGEFLSAEPYTDVLWSEGYDANGRPVEVDGARYLNKPFLQSPSAIGGHNWHSMSYNPSTGLVYIPVIKSVMEYKQPENFKADQHVQNIGVDLEAAPLISAEFMQLLKEKVTRGELLAWNPKTQTAAWRVQHKRTWNGGTLSTAGNLVFQGTADQQFMAFDAQTGETLWSFNTLLGIVAAPSTYEIEGEQYVAIMAKWGGGYPLAVGLEPMPGLNKGRLFVFKLGSTQAMPAADIGNLHMAKAPLKAERLSSESLSQAKSQYMQYCSGCHGLDVVSGGGVPDLRYKASQYPFGTFKLFVLDGILKDRGMVSFQHVLTEEDAKGIYAYILQEAERAYASDNDVGLVPKLRYWALDGLASYIVLAMDGSPLAALPGVLLIGLIVFGLVSFKRKKRIKN